MTSTCGEEKVLIKKHVMTEPNKPKYKSRIETLRRFKTGTNRGK